MMSILTTVPPDIVTVAGAVLVLYTLVSLLFIALIFYFIFVGGAIRMRKSDNLLLIRLIVLAMPLVFGISMSAVYYLATQSLVLGSAIALGVGMAIFSGYYVGCLRPKLRGSDYRVHIAVGVWTFVDLVVLTILVLLHLFRDTLRISGQFEISYDIIVQCASLFISALGILLALVMRAEQAQRTAQLQLYQTLELQSVALFRFECENEPLVRALLFDGPAEPGTTPEAEAKAYVVHQYACQMLNLFEMAVRFRVQGILPPEVFGSWVIWIWETCKAERFQQLWTANGSMPMNYVADLRAIIDNGIAIARDTKGDDAAKRAAFFSAVADNLNCGEIETWLTAHPPAARAVGTSA